MYDLGIWIAVAFVRVKSLWCTMIHMEPRLQQDTVNSHLDVCFLLTTRIDLVTIAFVSEFDWLPVQRSIATPRTLALLSDLGYVLYT